MRRNQIILPIFFFNCYDILKTKKSSICLFIPPGVLLVLILCLFWHEHPYSVSLQRDQALFEVVAVVTDTVLTLELASSFTNKSLLQSSRVSTMK